MINWNWKWIKNKFFQENEIEGAVKTSEEVAPRKFVFNLCKEIEAGEYIEEYTINQYSIKFNRNKDTSLMIYILVYNADLTKYELTLWIGHSVVNLTLIETDCIYKSYKKNKDIKNALELKEKIEGQQKAIEEIESWVYNED